MEFLIDGHWTAMSPFLFLTSGHHEAGTWEPNYAPRMSFWTMIFYNLKNSHQDLSNEGSNFILSSLKMIIELLKHSHFLTNYLKLQLLDSNLRIGQDSEF